MTTIKLYCTIVLSLVLTVASAQQPYQRLLISLDSRHTLAGLAALGVEVDHGDYRPGVSIESDFNSLEQQQIANAGYRYTVKIADVAAYYAQQNAPSLGQLPTKAAAHCGGATTNSITTPLHFKTGSMGGFLTYQELLDQLDSMRALYPQYISARQPIDTFTSIEGRPIYWLRISNRPDSNQVNKPQILYTALHHAREPAGLTNVIYYMWYLLENYATSAQVKALVDNSEMYIVPCVNPDGYIYNQTTNPNGGGLWRKNRRINADSTAGVDLNRNYGYKWGYDNTGSSPTTTSETYRGTAAFSEPELQAIKWLSLQHQFKIAINYHTYSNMLIYPWGYQASLLTPDSSLFVAMAKTMTERNGYKYGTGDQTVGYTTNGDSDDWMYGEQTAKNKILSMTPEAGSNAYGFWPPASAVVSLCQENFDLIYRAHQLLLRYLAVSYTMPKIITTKQFQFRYEAQRLGLDSPGSYTVRLRSIDPRVSVTTSIKSITNPALLARVVDSFGVVLSPSITTASDFKMVLEVGQGLYTTYDTIMAKYVGGDTIYYNNCNAINAYTPNGTWDMTTTSYVSPTGAITDSRVGNYADNSNTTVTLSSPIDLRAATTATLLYQARWELEQGYDYTRIEARAANDSNWTPLCGRYTNQGKNVNDSVNSLYDGYQTAWVQEAIDITPYIGSKLYLRFHLVTDPFSNYDGFYFDDLTVLGTIDSSRLTGTVDITAIDDWQLYPNPAATMVLIRLGGLIADRANIYNTLGEIVSEQQLKNGQLSIAGLPAGIYYISLYEGRNKVGNATKKLVIAR